MLGSLTSTIVAITTSTTTGPSVQSVSSRLAPWIWAPSTSRARRLRRYLITNAIRSPSTRTNTNATKPVMIQYVVEICCAFSDSAGTGPKPPLPASAGAAATSPSASTATSVRWSFDRTGHAIL